MRKKIRYLLLDFDGVTHPYFPTLEKRGQEDALLVFLPAIEEAIRACPHQVYIVIASNWRGKYTLDKMRGYFSKDIAEAVVGVTPELPLGQKPGGRLAEAQAWIEANAPGAAWVALDDMEELYAAGPETAATVAMVWCPDMFGQDQAKALLEALEDPQEWAKKQPGPLLSRWR